MLDVILMSQLAVADAAAADEGAVSTAAAGVDMAGAGAAADASDAFVNAAARCDPPNPKHTQAMLTNRTERNIKPSDMISTYSIAIRTNPLKNNGLEDTRKKIEKLRKRRPRKEAAHPIGIISDAQTAGARGKLLSDAVDQVAPRAGGVPSSSR